MGSIKAIVFNVVGRVLSIRCRVIEARARIIMNQFLLVGGPKEML